MFNVSWQNTMMLVIGALLLPTNRRNVCECENVQGNCGCVVKRKVQCALFLSHYCLEI